MSHLESGILEIQPVKQSLKPLLEGVAETFGPGAGEKDMTLAVRPASGGGPVSVRQKVDRRRRWAMWWTMPSSMPLPVPG